MLSLATFSPQSGLMIPRKFFLIIMPKIVIILRAVCLHVSSGHEAWGD